MAHFFIFTILNFFDDFIFTVADWSSIMVKIKKKVSHDFLHTVHSAIYIIDASKCFFRFKIRLKYYPNGVVYQIQTIICRGKGPIIEANKRSHLTNFQLSFDLTSY